MRSYWVRVGPGPMTGIFIRGENRPCALFGGMWNGAATVENSLALLRKVKHEITSEQGIPLLGVQRCLHPWTWRADCDLNISDFGFWGGWSWNPPSVDTEGLRGVYTQHNWKQVCLFVCLFVWLYPWHAEVPGPGTEPVPQQWQHRILNLLGHQGTPHILTFNSL